MNLILFEPAEIGRPLPRTDPRAKHILDVLRRSVGDPFDAGIVNGPRGKGQLTAIHDATLELTFHWQEEPPELAALELIVGLPRPQTARKILFDASSLGVRALRFVPTVRGEPSYSSSSLWSSGEFKRHLLAGAEQAFCTRIPVVHTGNSLQHELARVPESGLRIALDNYEAPTSLAKTLLNSKPTANAEPTSSLPVVLAIGSERGWTNEERALLRDHGFKLAHLGPRVLRTETACVAAIAIVKSTLDWL